MITASDITVSFGGFNLLDSINLHVNDGEKIGLVGKNGAGKSTLLKLIMGLEHPTEGKILISKDERLGYLPQQMEFAKGSTVFEEALKAFKDFYRLQDRLQELQEALNKVDTQSEKFNKLVVELNEVSDTLNVMSSEPPEAQTRRILLGLGFKEKDLNRQTTEFSQGWKMRIELAKVLLSEPKTLLLDEPTNHLDIESIQWFENYLKAFKGAVLLISHDRRFLDNITSRTVEIMLGKVYDYKVPYSKYKELRKERMEQQRASYENQQKMIKKTQEFIDKFRYKPTKSNQVQSRIKQLDKLDIIEVDLEDKAEIYIKFPPAPRSGDVVFQAKDLVVGYDTNVILNKINLYIQRGEKVAFVGRNGEGKTTLMKVIMRQLQPFSGEAKIGYNVNIGYFAQNQEEVLDKSYTVFETLDNIAVGDIRTKLKNILGAFLFKGEDIDKKVAVLSGGERARLAMAKLMLEPYNLLALDEPTNHMDLQSKEIIKQALKSYDGSLILVSHDRDFLTGLVDKVFEFKDGAVKEYLGGMEQYLEHLQTMEVYAGGKPSQVADNKKDTNVPDKTKQNNSADSIAPQTSQQYRQKSQEHRKKRKEIEKIEDEINRLDKELETLETELSSGNRTPEEIEDLSMKYSLAKELRDSRLDEWYKMSF